MFPRSTIAAMAAAADAAIDIVLLNGASRTTIRPRKEVDYVAAVTLGGIHQIAAAWRPLCAGHGLNMSLAGVFCHAAPVVEFRRRTEPTKCELADLLVVTDIWKRGKLTRRASLIQAKMARAKDRVSLTGPSSANQLGLYQNWYRFDFIDPIYGMKEVDFHPGPDVAWSGSFGAIDSRFDARPHWTQHLARPTPRVISRGDPRLGKFVAEMADGTQGGYGRLATPSLNTDWSKTIELLLRVTYVRAFGDKATFGPTRPPRGTNAVVCFGNTAIPYPNTLVDRFIGKQPPYDGIIPGDLEREPNGLSVFHVELTTGED